MRRATWISKAILLACLCPRVCGAQVAHGGLFLKDEQMPRGARLIGIELHMARAAFESATSLPAGWHLEIDNLPQGPATLLLRANPGASPISEDSFRKIDLQVTETISGDTRFEVWGWFTAQGADGKPIRFPFSTYSFQFVERYARRRIHSP